MRALRLAASLCVLAVGLLTGCNDDCERYCGRQADFIEACLPEFGDSWSDVGDSYADEGEFEDACTEAIDTHSVAEVAEICGAQPEDDDVWKDCEATVLDGVQRTCSSTINLFSSSCTDYWRGTQQFIPEEFVPERPTGDDDSASGDDDDSATGDDDDDSATGDDDDDSAAGDDDSSAG